MKYFFKNLKINNIFITLLMLSGCSFVFVNLVKYMFNGTHSIFKKFRPYHEPKGIMLRNQTLLLKQWNSMGKRWKRNLILRAEAMFFNMCFCLQKEKDFVIFFFPADTNIKNCQITHISTCNPFSSVRGSKRFLFTL